MLSEHLARQYHQAHHSKFPRLLKLIVLREAVHEFHRLKSSLMAQSGRKSESVEIEAALRTLEHAPQADLAQQATLEDLFSQRLTVLPAPTIPPRYRRLWAHAKVSRPDRNWERAILLEALQRGWRLGVVSRPLPLSTVEAQHTELSQGLWPDGAVLWLEGSTLGTSSATTVWKARWWIVTRKAKPGIQDWLGLF